MLLLVVFPVLSFTTYLLFVFGLALLLASSYLVNPVCIFGCASNFHKEKKIVVLVEVLMYRPSLDHSIFSNVRNPTTTCMCPCRLVTNQKIVNSCLNVLHIYIVLLPILMNISLYNESSTCTCYEFTSITWKINSFY